MQKYDNINDVAIAIEKELNKISIIDLIEQVLCVSMKVTDRRRTQFFDEDAILIARNLMPYAKAKLSNSQDTTNEILNFLDTCGFTHHKECFNDFMLDISLNYELRQFKELMIFTAALNQIDFNG